MKRVYSCEVIIYSTPNTIQNCIQNWDYIRHWLIALHDKDVDENGAPLKDHCHCYLTFRGNVSFSYIAKNLTLVSNGAFIVDVANVQRISGSYRDCYLYAIHANEPDKFQYSPDILFSDSLRFWKRDYSTPDNVAYQIVKDMEAGVRLREMAQKYGREFILNYSRYHDFFDLLRDSERFDNSTKISDDLLF